LNIKTISIIHLGVTQVRWNHFFKKGLILLLLLVLNSHTVFAQNAAKLYLEKHSQKAIMIMQKTGIPASIILGVSMVESANGTSRNAKLLNNYFGIKGKNNLAKTNPGSRSAYKGYDNVIASFRDFARIIQNKKYYPTLKGTYDVNEWLFHMNKHGYAEAKGTWVAHIKSMVKKYNLKQFDSVKTTKVNNIIIEDNSYPYDWNEEEFDEFINSSN
jgi:flagellum-specific peptidoglycan hydrolase FlgJ